MTLLEDYGLMCLMRAFDEVCIEGARSEAIHGELHVAIGQEAVAAGMAGSLRPGDALVSTHRNHFHAIAKGVPLEPMLAEIFGRSSGLCGGFGGHMHLFDPDRNFSTTGIVGSSLPVALGYAYAMWLEGDGRMAVGVTGDGGANAGPLYECLNVASAWRLPLVVLVENNEYAISVRASDVSATSVTERAAGFGCLALSVDGSDVEAVAAVFSQAAEHTRSGGGLALIEARCARFRGHYEGDLDLYRSESEKQRDLRERDPLKIARDRLLARGEATEDDLNCITQGASSVMTASVKAALAGPLPAPEEALQHVFVGGLA
jgi:acetoin:2,6-dichlorophenolindophenol oxidoreductase subunit alpha